MKLPTITLSEEERETGNLQVDTLLIGRQLLANKGVLFLENAFPPEFIGSLGRSFRAEHGDKYVSSEDPRTLVVGDRRLMFSVPLDGVFNSPALYANPLVLSFVRAALGDNFVLGSLGSVVSLPGAEDQHVHRDHPRLFNDSQLDIEIPAFAINVIIPLVHLNDLNGTTRVWPCSHRVWLDEEAKTLVHTDPLAATGSCILIDYRLLHGGTGNLSNEPRPILYAVYQRPWFQDYVNFGRIAKLSISAEQFGLVPDPYKAWFEHHIEE